MAARELPRGVPEEQTPIPGGGESKGKAPKFGTQRVAEAGGEIPRVVDPLDRSPDAAKFTRYKVTCRNYRPQEDRYILAKKGDEDGVRACYLMANGLDAVLDELKKNGVKDPEVPLLNVKALPD